MIKNFCNALLILLFFLQAKAQQPDIDSLKRLIPLAKNDTATLILYTNLTDAYTEIKPDSAYYFARSLAMLSHQLGLKLNEAYG